MKSWTLLILRSIAFVYCKSVEPKPWRGTSDRKRIEAQKQNGDRALFSQRNGGRSAPAGDLDATKSDAYKSYGPARRRYSKFINTGTEIS